MKTLETNCPRCNSLQKFAKKEKVIGDEIYCYVKCFVCGEEINIDIYPRERKFSRKISVNLRNRKIRSNLLRDDR